MEFHNDLWYSAAALQSDWVLGCWSIAMSLAMVEWSVMFVSSLEPEVAQGDRRCLNYTTTEAHLSICLPPWLSHLRDVNLHSSSFWFSPFFLFFFCFLLSHPPLPCCVCGHWNKDGWIERRGKCGGLERMVPDTLVLLSLLLTHEVYSQETDHRGAPWRWGPSGTAPVHPSPFSEWMPVL